MDTIRKVVALIGAMVNGLNQDGAVVNVFLNMEKNSLIK